MLKDQQEKNASRRWKTMGGGLIEGGGVCWSADGLSFPKSECYAWPAIPHMHWDSWWNMFWLDEATATSVGEGIEAGYVATGRADTMNPSGDAENPCGNHQWGELFPACLRPCGANGKPAGCGKGPQCTFAECYKASRAVSRVQTHGSDLRTMVRWKTELASFHTCLHVRSEPVLANAPLLSELFENSARGSCVL
eukprot:COSAG06_NODE_848_length_11971_cov_10.199882_9_plen_195_part_00